MKGKHVGSLILILIMVAMIATFYVLGYYSGISALIGISLTVVPFVVMIFLFEFVIDEHADYQITRSTSASQPSQ